MSDEQKYYHELETMQELGLLEEGTNICELTAQYVQDKRDNEITKMIEENSVKTDFENQMVVNISDDEI